MRVYVSFIHYGLFWLSKYCVVMVYFYFLCPDLYGNKVFLILSAWDFSVFEFVTIIKSLVANIDVKQIL